MGVTRIRIVIKRAAEKVSFPSNVERLFGSKLLIE
jgi:hypothetical protein